MNDDLLHDSVALVTGAGGGLGTAQALALGRAGAVVVATDIDRTAAEATARLLRSEGLQASSAALDVTDIDSIEALFSHLDSERLMPDILINNAGVSVRQSAFDATPAVFDLTHGVNVRGAYFMAQACARRMRDHGGGSIINLASIGGLVVDGPRSSVYDASKAAVVHMTRNLAYEWGPHGIRVNALAPGYMRTSMTEDLMPDPDTEADLVNRHIPLGRVGEVADIMAPVVFLAGPGSSYITGACLPVDGGWIASY